VRPRLYVIQKHAARRVHYDLRLEWGGTLWSWAVPKVPDPDPSVKRLAVHVEDHPVEYGDFEGIIPEGNYGAGAVIVWDRGQWVPLTDPDTAIETGKLHFEIRGYKLRGEWILVRTKGQSNEWLLFKKADAWARKAPAEAGARDGAPYAEESVLSGLTVEELRGGGSTAETTRRALEKLSAPRRPVDPMKLGLMLAETADEPFSSDEWLFELKIDGYRAIAARGPDGGAVLRSRNGHDITAVFPDVARALRALPYAGLVLDGELTVLDENGRPSFQRLQQRSQMRRPSDIERAAIGSPATLVVFDLLAFDGFDLRTLPLRERKRLLRPLLPKMGPLRYADHVEGRGVEMYEKVHEMGLEGIIAKRGDAPYRAGRSTAWLKIVVERSADFVVCGYTEPRGSRAGFGALLLGVYDGGELVYAGRAGTGFDDAQLVEYRAALDRIRRRTPPCKGNIREPGEGALEPTWVRPVWVVEVRYKSWTDEGLLRAPVFMRRRDDKDPAECVRVAPEGGAGPEGARAVPEARAAGRRRAGARRAERREIRFSNLDKVFWPDDGFTKGDLIDHYRAVSPWILPYLKDRPVVLTRYPDGITGKSFYQKNMPDFLPDWIRTVKIWSGHAEKEIEYVVCEDEATLLYIANLASIPLHMWSSRVASIQRPDFCILDLDPGDAPFRHVVTLTRAIRSLCSEIELPCYLKTSGSTGLHVLIPLGGQCTFEQSRLLGKLLAKAVEGRHRELATTARSIGARKGRVYLDYLQNRHGQLLVAPYCVRALPGAPVSTPLAWRELTNLLDPRGHDIRSVRTRLKRLRADPMLALLTEKPDLVSALEKLAGRM
jgi:bifunctional non-homologous end joining protein LigD